MSVSVWVYITVPSHFMTKCDENAANANAEAFPWLQYKVKVGFFTLIKTVAEINT